MIILICSIKGGNTIKDAIIKVADENNLAFMDGLQRLGMNQKVARLITYLKDVKEGSSRDIEMATDLRLPEVSIAMRTMREMGWITETEIKGNGKGRPQKIYALRSTIDEIIGYYEAQKTQESARTMAAIQRLKELSSA